MPSLARLTQSAGYIFGGTVVSVTKSAIATPGIPATMQISFHVEQAVRGVRAGQVFTMREWAGLWDAGERYHPGERVMLFLYPPSRLGLTSPVAGTQGRFAIDGNGVIALPPPKIEVQRPIIRRQAIQSAIDTQTFIRAIRQVEKE